MKQDCFRLYCQENEKHMFCSSYILTIIESLRALVKMYIMTKKTTKKSYDKSSKSFMRFFLFQNYLVNQKYFNSQHCISKWMPWLCCGECLEGEILVSSKTSSNLLSVCWFSLWCLLGFEAMASTNSCVAFLKMLFFKAQACMVEQLFFRQIFTYTQVKWNKRVQQQNKLLLVNYSRTLELWSAVSRQTRNKIGILSTTHILQQRANIFTLMWWFLLTWKLKNGSNGRWHFWQLQKRVQFSRKLVL